MRVAHEAPLSIFDKVQSVTDYDYALVHLFEESEEYYNKFKKAVDNGRYVILDNSIFELGKAFNMDDFADYVRLLKPSAYIVPDSLEDAVGTMANYLEWDELYGDLPGEKIGVVQGSNLDDIISCYKFMELSADKIAISFDYSFFQEQFPNEPTKYHSWVKGRQKLIDDLYNNNIINTNKPHHLLGCGLPQEFAHYKKYKWIDTVDTSNPVVHGMAGIKYNKYKSDSSGLEDKISTKLFTMLNEQVANIDDVLYNIAKFKYNLL